MLKTIIGKLERKKIMIQRLMWLNWSKATINATLQFLDIYIYIDFYMLYLIFYNAIGQHLTIKENK